VNFADLQQRVLDLEGFEDEAETASEAKLELIQQAWLDAYLDSMV
jgi:FeS assembly protein IscX